ncbi:MAG: nucleotidyltransferase domain-containing protein [Candidatus Margulisiibacteriota bacterium]|nr:nucleotidyltransferase domain-containing protein [Candidatus Margulisiibacteriota bacterium]
MRKDHNEIISKGGPFLEKEADVITAYLYGSRAEGAARENSDIDIAILLDEKQTPQTPYGRDVNLARQLEKIFFPLKVDIRILNHASPFFRFQVIKKGKVIHSKDENQRADFEGTTRNKYFDLKPLYKLLFADMDQRLSGGTYGNR